MQGKQFFLTYPQCGMSKERALEEFKKLGPLKEWIIAEEDHKDGTPHLHAYLVLEKKLNTTNANYFDLGEYHGNYQTVKNKYAVMKYCNKEGRTLSSIDISEKIKAKDGHKAYIGQQLIDGMDVTDVVIANPELLFEYKKLKENVTQFRLDTTKQADELRVNFWIYGAPGIGKSQWAKRNFPGAYKKASNKWWDGYTGEHHVIMEDVDTNVLGHYLKIWGDNYAISGEVKGGTIPLKYKQMVVTSNYKISELWKDDPQMAAAIARRYKTYTITGDYEMGYQLASIDTHYNLY